MIRFVSLLLMATMPVAAKADVATNTAIIPVSRTNAGWITRHESMNQQARQRHIDLIYVGDSIVEHFDNQGKEVWAQYYAPRNALNLGIGGDRTEHVLWRLDHGNIDGLAPKLAIVMIGQNNGGKNTGEEIGAGVIAIVQKIRAKLPNTKILLLGIFQRREKPTPERAVLAQANEIASKLADDKTIFYMDINSIYVQPDGSIPRGLMYDFEHPTPLGHRVWAEAIETKVAELMGDKPVVASVRALPLLPGQREFVFSMYGAPGELAPLKQLVGVMREQHLGNGFDPGPSPNANSKPIYDYLATVGWPVICNPGGDMQIKGGRGALGRENEAALEAMDRAGVFTAVQLGEWGYYFHNLAPAESWWHENFGKDFEQFKHLMKPPGLAGYDRRPTSKQECYDVIKDYFMSKSRDLLNRVNSVTGHSHYEAYAGEWGARCIGLELGENIAFTQSKLAFARGAARQWQKPWSVQVSPWMHGACTSSGPLRKEGNDARGLDAGHSLSFYERMWLHAWFAGAAMVTPENSVSTFFEKAEAPWTLSSHGQKAAEVFQFMRTHERGVPFTPVAIVMDHLAGYNAYMDKPWGILEPTAGDRQLRDLFDHQLFPGSDHIHANPFPANPELSYLRPTPYGEIFDVQLTSASAEMLSSYPVILLAGDIEFDDELIAKLERSVKRGNKLLLSSAHQAALGSRFDRLAKFPGVEVLPPWINPATGRAAAISESRLQQLVRETLPVEVSGDPIQYQINRTTNGWVIELINNNDVIKQRDQPAIIDPNAIARVMLRPKFRCASAREWKSNRAYAKPAEMRVEVGPGQSVFVEIVSAQ